MTEQAAVSIRLIAEAPNPNPSFKGWFYLKREEKSVSSLWLTKGQGRKFLIFLP